MIGRARIVRLLSLGAALALVLGPVGLATASAAGEGSGRDSVRLVKVTAKAPAPNASTGPVQFDVTVDYQLQSVPRAFFLLFVFEGTSSSATNDSSNGTWISSGTGQTHLTTTYRGALGSHPLTLVAALFRDQKTLLAWSRTQPFSLTPWPGQQQFSKALAARQAGNYAAAVNDLTEAIKVAPNVGTFYCWRADTRLHLGQYGEAIGDYTRALELMPGDRSCRVGRGIAYLWEKKPSQAKADLTAVIDQSAKPDRWTIWALRARGVANADLGEAANAIADYRAYLSLVPTVPDRVQIESWIASLQASSGATTSDASTSDAAHPN